MGKFIYTSGMSSMFGRSASKFTLLHQTLHSFYCELTLHLFDFTIFNIYHTFISFFCQHKFLNMLSNYPLCLISLILSLTSLASGHLSIKYPKPIQLDERGGAIKYTTALKANGSDFPCKGVLKVGTNEGIGPSVASWRAGDVAIFELEPLGVAAHWGGSCQASLSYDFGKTWQVLRSFVGGCPRGAQENNIPKGSDQRYPFRIPQNAPGGTAIFAWTYFTVTGFREMYMVSQISFEAFIRLANSLIIELCTHHNFTRRQNHYPKEAR